MKDGLSIIAVVPARGGDHEVPYLNIKNLGQLPLIAHTLAEARKSRYIDRLVVSTDDDHVEQVAKDYGGEVPFRRPKELSGDLSEIKQVIQHAVRSVEEKDETRFDIVVTLQATSPFRTVRQIDEAIDKLVAEELDSVISLKELRSLTWRMPEGKLEPLFRQAGRRDEIEPLYQEDGAIRVVRREVLDTKERLGAKVGYVLMDKRSSITVHDIYDFWLAEKLTHLPRVIFRVDGGGKMGMGHVYRSLAVAEALKKGVPNADICFLMKADHPEGIQHVSRAGHQVRVLSGRALDAIRDYSPNVIVNDLPRLEVEYLRSLATLGASTINLVDSIEDFEDPKAIATTIVATMQEAEAELDDYYAGPAFAILRDSFQNRPPSQVDGEGRRIVVSFGGSDPQNLTLKTLRALDGLDVQVTAVLGPAFGYGAELEASLKSLKTKPRVLENVEHMADILYDADLVICSGGMTVFEIAALGRPGIVLCQNAREKKRMEGFERYGSIVHLGLGPEVSEAVIRSKAEELLADAERRRGMSEAGARLVDAAGANRVAEVMIKARGRGPANGGLWE